MTHCIISTSKFFALSLMSFIIICGILEMGYAYNVMGQPVTEPGPLTTSIPNATKEPGPLTTSIPNATETSLAAATTTTTTSTFSYTKGGFHIYTTITNTTTVSPVQR